MEVYDIFGKITTNISQLMKSGRISGFNVFYGAPHDDGKNGLSISVYIKYDVFCKNIASILYLFFEFDLNELKEITIDKSNKVYIWRLDYRGDCGVGRLFLYVKQ